MKSLFKTVLIVFLLTGFCSTESEALTITQIGSPSLTSFGGVSFQVMRDDSTYAIVSVITENPLNTIRQEVHTGDPRFSLSPNNPINSWYPVSTGGGNGLRFYHSSNFAPSTSDINPGLTIEQMVTGNSGGRVNWQLLTQGAVSSTNIDYTAQQVVRVTISKQGPGNIWIQNLIVHGTSFSADEFTPPSSPTNTPVPPTNTSVPTSTPVPVGGGAPTNTSVPLPPTNTPVPLATNTAVPTITISDGLHPGENIVFIGRKNELLIETIKISGAVHYAIGDIAPKQGSVTIDVSGLFRYMPVTNYVGTDNFTVKGFDGQNSLSLGEIEVIVSIRDTVPTSTSTSTNTPTVTPTGTKTPTGTNTSTVTPTDTNTPIPTTTSTPTVTPTNTRRPGNHAPSIKIVPGSEIGYQGQSWVFPLNIGWSGVSVDISDPDGDLFFTVTVDNGHVNGDPTLIGVDLSTTINGINPFIFRYRLVIKTDRIGNNQKFAVYAYDGSDTAKLEQNFAVVTMTGVTNTPVPTATATNTNTPVPTRTSTPTVTPVPKPLVSNIKVGGTKGGNDGLDAIWQRDQSPGFFLNWEKEPSFTDVNNYDIYVSQDDQPIKYIGTSSPLERRFLWNGPEAGHEYRFSVFIVTKSGSPHHFGPFAGKEVNLFSGDNPKAVAYPDESKITIAFDPSATTAKVNELSDSTPISDYHFYANNGNNIWTFIGQTRDWRKNIFTWQKGDPFVVGDGPLEGRNYTFAVFLIGQDGRPLDIGPFYSNQVEYGAKVLRPTSSPTAIVTPTRVPTAIVIAAPTATPAPPTPTNTLVPLIPTSTRTPTVTATRTSTPTSTKTPVPPTATPTIRATFTPVPPLPWNVRAPWDNNFPDQGSVKYFIPISNEPENPWRADFVHVGWVPKDGVEGDGYAHLWTEETTKKPVHILYNFFVDPRFIRFVTMGMFSHNPKGASLILVPLAGFRDKRGVMNWLTPGALQSNETALLASPITGIDDLEGHFITYDLHQIYQVLADLVDEFGQENLAVDGLHFLFMATPPERPELVIDGIFLLSENEFNLPVWSGYRAAYFDMLARMGLSLPTSLVKPAANRNDNLYVIPPEEQIRAASDGAYRLINPSGLPFAPVN